MLKMRLPVVPEGGDPELELLDEEDETDVENQSGGDDSDEEYGGENGEEEGGGDESEEDDDEGEDENKEDDDDGDTLVSSDEGEEDEDETEEHRLQKLSAVTAESIITEFHPESRILGLNEVKALAVVQRQLPDGVILDDPLHRTLPFLTKYERARVLGLRIAQLNDGADTLLVPVPDDSIIDNSIIAEMELQQKVIPFIIQRPLPNGVSEYWHLRDLELIL